MPLQRWSDDRLDDLLARVDANTEQLRRLTDVMVQQAQMTERLEDLSEDTRTCLSEIRQMARDQAQKEDAQRQREIEIRRERIVDRRWLIGTALTVSAIVVAALGVFLG